MKQTQARTKALELLPDTPPTSLLDVACLYASCDVYEKLTSDLVDFNVEPDALQAMTPTARDDCFDPDSEHKVISVNIDATTTPVQLGDPVVTVENCVRDHFYRIGFIGNSDKTGLYGDDYSVTNHVNGKTPEQISNDGGGRYARGRLERWVAKYAEHAIDNNHPDASLMKSLLELVDNEHALARIEKAVVDALPEDEDIEGFITLRVREPGSSTYRHPGEIDVLNQVALARKYEHIRDGIGIDDKYTPYGEGVDYLTNKTGEVIGGSGGILNQYSKKHADKFSKLSLDNAHKGLPLSVENSVTISIFESVRDEFMFLINRVRFYYFPYPITDITADVFEEFYNTVYSQLKETESPEEFVGVLNSLAPDTSTPAEDATGISQRDLFDDSMSDDNQHYHVYNLVYISGNPARVVSDNPQIDLHGITSIANAYSAHVSLFGEYTTFEDAVANLSFDTSTTTRKRIIRGSWFWQLTADSSDPGEDQTTTEATLSDGRIQREGRLIQGDSIDTNALLKRYVTLLIRAQRQGWLFNTTSDSQQGAVPFRQYLQLITLNTADTSHGKGIKGYSVDYDTLMTSTENREERLEAFLSANEALDSDGAKAVFLLGALVGRMSAQQSYGENQVSRKMAEQYPIDRVNKRTIQDITSSVIAKNEEYAARDEFPQLNQRYIKRMMESALQQASPTEWDLSDVELKWLYGFGISYGKNDTSNNYNPNTDTDN